MTATTRGLSCVRLLSKHGFCSKFFSLELSSISTNAELGESVVASEETPYNQRKHFSNKNKIFIGSKSFNHDKIFLSSLMSQFGKVKAVDIPRLNQYVSNEQVPGEYRFGFITFHDEESYMKALKTRFIENNKVLFEIKDVDNQGVNKGVSNLSALNTIAIHDLPDSVRIQDILDHFKSFGEVAFVNLIYNGTVRKTKRNVNFAFITFKTGGSVIQHVIDSVHSLDSIEYPVTRVDPRTRQNTQKCMSVFVQGVPHEACNENVLYDHFSKFSKVKRVVLLKNLDTGEITGNAFVDFFKQEDAHRAELDNHEIAGTKLNIKALGWLSG